MIKLIDYIKTEICLQIIFVYITKYSEKKLLELQGKQSHENNSLLFVVLLQSIPSIYVFLTDYFLFLLSC